MSRACRFGALNPLTGFSFTDFCAVFLTVAVINNVALVQLTGVSGLFAFSNSRQQSIELALVSFIAISLATFVNGLLHNTVLLPLGLPVLKLVLFTLVSVGIAMTLSSVIRKQLPLSWRRDQLAFLLAGANSAAIGLALTNSTAETVNLLQLLAVSLGGAAGFSILLLAFSAMRERLNEHTIPVPFRGSAIQLITAGVVAMALFGLTGVN